MDARIEPLLRELAPQVLGVLARRFRDFGAAEDAVQEALLAAAETWERTGLPENPRGWLLQVAHRRIIDHLRRESARRTRDEAFAADAEPLEPGAADPAEDDTLLLLFMCCHPALSTASAIALTLRAVGGLTTAEIASAFLVPEATIAQRISRAKRAIRDSGEPFRAPAPDERTDRLGAVLHVLYLTFSEGYAASSGGELQRTDLVHEAIRLTREVHGLLPDDPEVSALLALMLLTDARRAARSGPAGELIPLDEQDRSRWNRAAIAEGVALVGHALSRGPVGDYALQAAIAAVHDEAPQAAETDWPQILALYELLGRRSDSPLVALNHAVALAMVHGPRDGLARLDELAGDERLRASHRLDAVRAHLLESAGDRAAAVALYRSAAERTANLREREFLLRKASDDA